ncbi:integral membrane protein [Streptomyces bingchenggensis BCW-1]|uniref:Integral membrane protein n=2 Tax=Streptomyces TaxID=1883 RepID=D7BR26_STRBB|nr:MULTISPECIES: membrane protein [Streptomyces]ADI11376.1 integral membrane protein [Streptomyces bingchenggensis BCW-1]
MTELARTDAPAGEHDDRTGRAVPATLRRAAPALLAYTGTRLLGVVVLAIWAAATGKSWYTLLSGRWDAVWYSRIAEEGYGYTLRLPDGSVHSDLAFFPLLPWLERLVSALTPLDAAGAGLAVSWIASLFAAWGIFAIGDRLRGRRVGTALVVLWAVLPVGIVQSMAYSESLFTALAAWAVYALLTGRWVWAGSLAAAAGLTRPVGAAVIAAVWITAAASLLPAGRWRPAWRLAWRLVGRLVGRLAGREHRRMLLGVAVAPLGWLGYVVWVGVRTGSVTGYLDVQSGWRNGFDGGVAFARFTWDLLAGPGFAAGLAMLTGVALLIWVFIRCVRRRDPLPLLVYAGVVLALALTAKGYFGSKPRLLLPAFPILLPLAAALARLRTARAVLILGSVGLASAAYGAFWLTGTGPP